MHNLLTQNDYKNRLCALRIAHIPLQGFAMISRAEAEEIIALIEDALKKGDHPDGHKCLSRQRLASATACKYLGIHRTVMSRKLKEARTEYGLEPDWSLYNDQVLADGNTDPILVRRLKDKLSKAESRAASAERNRISSDAIREGILGLAAIPLEPRPWSPPTGSKRGPKEGLILMISDVHMGETIDKNQMGGRNSFDKKICGDRLKRLFQGVVKMGTVHWSGPPPGVIYVILGGDLISGEIHDELAKSNDLLAIPAVKELATYLISGIELLVQSFDCEIRVVSIPGNHGRTTRKPESKGFVVNSYDTLVAWLVERWFVAKGTKQITFTAPASGDALINICGWNFLFTHGDRIGSRGGMGMVGPVATIARGMQRVIQDYAAEQIVVDYVIVGHFHTSCELEQGFANGCLSGPSEYSRSGRMRSSPPSQWLLSVHPIHGVARRWKILVGDPSEGTICAGRSS